MTKPKTLVELVEQRGDERADATLYTFLVDGESQEAHMTYAELRRQARMIGAALQAIGATGERALLLYPPGLEYVTAFFGCLHAGVIAVPAYPPNPAALDRTLPRLLAIAADARATIIMTTAPLKALAAGVLGAQDTFRWVTTDALDASLEAAWAAPAVGASSLAFLQYTSGSTDTPKGVMVSHANLLHNSQLIGQAFGHDPSDVGVIWLPPYHDMGLIGGIIQPLYIGGRSVLVSPLHFLQRPLRWLAAVSRYRATTSGGPNFAYELCIRKTTPAQRAALDLSAWKCAFNGAEPIRAETLARFADAFAPAGFRPEAFYPCYGLAETTLIATGGALDAAPIVRSFDARALGKRRVEPVASGGATLVGCGRALGGEVAIIDPETGRACAPDQIGEIWLAGPSVAGGYYRREEETARAFRATRTDRDGGPYLRTGDLGFLVDGELFVAGRVKDLIIIRGQNHYPQDIEHTAESTHVALRPGCGAAFAVDADGEERLVLTYEIDPAHAGAAEAIMTDVRRAIADVHELSTHAIVLVAHRSIPKTSSGKIQRHACKAAYLAGELAQVAAWEAPSAAAATAAPAGAAATAAAPAGAAAPAPALAPAAAAAAAAAGAVAPAAAAAAAGAVAPAPAAAPLTPSEGRAEGADRVEGRSLLRWLIDRVAEQTGLAHDRVDADCAFAQFGMSSLQMVSLTGELETHLGRRLAPTLTYEHPTIRRLVDHLAGVATDRAAPAIAAATAGEPIAIVGIGCRFPGADGPDAFWQLLHDGVDAIRDLPDARRKLAPAASPRLGGYLDAIELFDPELFRISQREADAMDPQQRLLLEVAWRALEDAGHPIAALRGTPTGVFVGISTSDYGRRRLAADPSTGLGAGIYAVTGNALSIAANRISYALDLGGPSVAVDTACSSSLVAVHLACQSLRSGESTVALAGGANLVLSDALTATLAGAGFLAPDGRCKAFDASADGYVRGEGAGVIVMKPLSRAVADGDRVYAVIRGSAVNSDGRSNGLTAPSVQAQRAVLRRAYADAQVDPATVEYVEAHGTGTALGDPIEAQALADVVGGCRLGSVKTNIGHLEAAAGIAGLIKTALAMHHGEVPASLHVREPNPRVGLPVQRERGPWRSELARAGVSSFGFGGTNAHVVVERAPRIAAPAASRAERPRILPLSAHHPEAATALAAACADQLATLDFAAACDAAARRRDHHDHRIAVAARTAGEAIELLRTARPQRRPSGRAPSLVYVFSGQGSQWPGIGTGLLAEPVARDVLAACDRSLAAQAGWSLLAALAAADEATSRLRDTAIAQPALVAVQLALAALFRDRGLAPAAVIGHSLGEIAAAHVAGAISLDDAMRVAWHRGRLLAAGRGAMALVERPLAEVGALVARFDRLAIAAENAPDETVVSGDPDQLAELATLAPCRMLPAGYAFHSPTMAPFQAPLGAALAGLATAPTTVPMMSTVTAALVDGTTLGADYWRRQICEPVRFAPAVRALVAAGHDHFVELGVPVLGRSLEAILRGTGGACVSALRRGRPDDVAVAEAIAALYTHGHDVAWDRLYADAPVPPVVALPPMPWVKRRCWLEEREPELAMPPEAHPLLGRPVPLATGHAWNADLDPRRLPYLADHKLDGTALVPATAWLEMAMAAALTIGPDRGLVEIELRRPLAADGDAARSTQVAITTDTRGRDQVRIASRGASGEWKLHATATITAPAPRLGLASGEASLGVSGIGVSGDALTPPLTPSEHSPQATCEPALSLSKGRGAPACDLAAIRKRCKESVSIASFHDGLARRGLTYGPAFRGIAELYRSPTEALARVVLPPSLAAEAPRYHVHPALLDACAQLVAALDPSGRAFVPVGADRARWFRTAPAAVWSWMRVTDPTSRTRFDLLIVDETGAPVAEVIGLRLLHLADPARRIGPERWRYEVRWQRQPLRGLPRAREAGTWLLLADTGGVADALAQRLAAGGDRCIFVHAPEELDGALAAAPALRGVIHLWSLDATAAAESPQGPALPGRAATPEALPSTIAELAAQQARCVDSAIALVRREPARLWLVTRGAQPLGDYPIAPVPAMLWGLGRTLAQERPDLVGAIVDLAPGAAPAQDAAALHRELTASDGEDQIAYRDARHVARLARAVEPAGPKPELACRADGAYLVSGGLGGIGLVVSRALADRGARRIILLARTALPPRRTWSDALPARVAAQVAAVRELEARGVAVHLAAVDVGDPDALATFLDDYRREAWPPIRGVVHLAGVLHDRTLARLEPAQAAEVFRAKVRGGWLLDRLVTEPLDFFVAFSSIAAVLGSAGQASYAAANAFLDALAHDRRRRGVPALAIDWGPWADVGVATAAGRGDRLSRGGVASIEPERGAELFVQLAAGTATQIAVVPIDWGQLARSFPSAARAPFLHDLIEAEAASPREPIAPRRALDAPALVDLLTAEIGRSVGGATARPGSAGPRSNAEGVAQYGSIRADLPLDRLGIDSLMGIELRARLETELGVSIPIGTLLAGPTIAELAALLAAQLAAPAPDRAPAMAAPRRGSSITAIQPLGSLPPFYCIHPGALDTECYDELAARLGDDRPFYCIRLAELESTYALDADAAGRASVEELARQCVEALVAAQPEGPYLLGGWSLGGVLAYEAARQLEATGARVARLVLFDSPTPGAAQLAIDDPLLVRAFASYLGARQGIVYPHREAELADVLAWARDARLLPPAAELAQLRSLFASYTRGLSWSTGHLTDYAPGPVAAPIVYVRATDVLAAYGRAFPDPGAWWSRRATSPPVMVDVPGDHYTMFLPPHVDTLGGELARILGAAW